MRYTSQWAQLRRIIRKAELTDGVKLLLVALALPAILTWWTGYPGFLAAYAAYQLYVIGLVFFR